MVNSKELLIIDAAKKEVKRIKLESIPLASFFSNDGKTLSLPRGNRTCCLKESGFRRGSGEA